MKNILIPRWEVIKLSSDIVSEISTHSLGQWLKEQTNDEFIVVPREFVLSATAYLETDHNIETVRWYL